jgi:hypothetical protein
MVGARCREAPSNISKNEKRDYLMKIPVTQ